MRNLILILLLTFILMACGEAAPEQKTNEKPYLFGDVSYPQYGIRYFRDERTGICFAERMFGSSDSYTFTSVPCANIDAYYKVNTDTNTEATNTSTNRSKYETSKNSNSR